MIKLEKDLTGSITELSLPLFKGSRKKVHFFNGRAIKSRGAKGSAIKEKKNFLKFFFRQPKFQRPLSSSTKH